MQATICIIAWLALFVIVMTLIVVKVQKYETEDQQHMDEVRSYVEHDVALTNALYADAPVAQRMRAVVNMNKDRSLHGKARVKARKAANRNG